MPTLILLNLQVYQAPEIVIMNHHDLGLSYFYRIKAMSTDQLTTCNGPYI